MRFSTTFSRTGIAVCGLLLCGVLAPLTICAQPVSAFNDSTVKFGPGSSRADIEAAGAAFVESGNRRIYIGTHQITANNQNPIVASFTGDTLDWVVNDYEVGFPDGRGVGLLWDRGNRLIVAFTITGGDAFNTSLSRWATGGWQTNYGFGGGAAVTFVMSIDPADGQPIAGTFVIARLSNNNSNSVRPTGLAFVGDRVVLEADSFFSPLRVNKARMVQDAAGASPFEYRLMFPADFSQPFIAEAIGWDGVTSFSDLEVVFADDLEAP